MRFFLCLIGFLFLTALHPFPAAAAQQGAAAAPAAPAAADTADLKDLSAMLHDDGKREKFLARLDALIKAREETAPPRRISRLIGFDKWGTEIEQEYRAISEKYGMTETVLSKALLTFITIPCFLLAGALIRRLSLMLARRLDLLRQRYALTHNRFILYARILRYIGYAFLFFLFIYTQLAIWDFFLLSFIRSQHFGALGSLALNIALTLILAVIIWEFFNGMIEYALRRSRGGQSTRLQTLLPLIRTVLFFFVMAMFALMLLSQLGIDILPLLAGAGVLGVAIGFGAQSMVKDFLTGFAIILGDYILVGDLVTVAGRTGFVERVSIKNVAMRGWDGTVYTVPFSEISTIENMSRSFSYYLMDIGVSYDSDTDEVEACLREIDAEMRADADFGKLILEPIEIFGVDRFADSAVIIRARIKTQPIRQWEVGWEFNRRMKRAFEQRGIIIPYPHRTVVFGTGKEDSAQPPLPVSITGLPRDGGETA